MKDGATKGRNPSFRLRGRNWMSVGSLNNRSGRGEREKGDEDGKRGESFAFVDNRARGSLEKNGCYQKEKVKD